jgi:dTDP-glucose 4,6-dehydratase
MVVAGGAGFLGSHLCNALANLGHQVVILDNFSTGHRENIADLLARGHEVFECDVSIDVPPLKDVDGVFNLASPASPPRYLERPLDTLAAGSEGTRRLLELATTTGARYLHASTSEIYGNPLVHPQRETYWGNVNPVGPRSVYDEAKRFGETLTSAYRSSRGTNSTIARIFNTYGPRLDPSDGRLVSNLMYQALSGLDLTVYGDGSQTRSLTYVSDQVKGLLALFGSTYGGPVNIGSEDELTVLEIARTVLEVTNSKSRIVFRALPDDDPVRRRPEVSLARELLNWEPTTTLRDGLVALRDDYISRGLVQRIGS